MLREIEAFMQTHSLPDTRFGRLFANDPRFVSDIRKGRSLREQSAQRLKAWMAGFDAAARLYVGDIE